MPFSEYESRDREPPPIPERSAKRGSHYTGSSKDKGDHGYEAKFGSSRLDGPFDQPAYSHSRRVSSSTIRSTQGDEPRTSSRYAPSSRDHPSAYEFEHKVASERYPHEKSSHYKSSGHESSRSSRKGPELSVDTSSRQHEHTINPRMYYAQQRYGYEASGRSKFSSSYSAFSPSERRSPGPFIRDYYYDETPSEVWFETDEERERRRRIFGDY